MRRRLILLAFLSACGGDAASDLPDTAPCLTGGNVLVLDGDPGDPVHPGDETIAANATARIEGSDGHAAVSFPVPAQGIAWSLAFEPPQVGTYDLGASIGATGRSCPAGATARFAIRDIVIDHAVIRELTAAFEQRCAGETGVLRGCVHVGL